MLMKQLEKQRDYPFDLDKVNEVREGFEKMISKVKPAKGVNLEEILIGNVQAEKYSLISKDSKNLKSLVLLYLPGGGYFMGSYKTHRAFVAKLCKEIGLQAYSITYRHAPEHPYPAAVDDAFEAYKWLLEEESIPAENIIIMGDSAGGGLALCLLHRIGQRNLPLPKAALGLSAWTDLTMTSETLKTKAEEDPFFNVKNVEISAIAYIGEESPKNPEISPLFADFEGWPPIFLQVGSREILLNDTLTIAEKMKEQGVSITVDVQEGMFHAFLILSTIPVIGKLIPEFKHAMKNVQMFVESL